MPLPKLTLVLGGARSGKSLFAEQLVKAQGGRAVYLATAEARDGEMRARVEAHQARRGADWVSREEPIELPRMIGEVQTSVEVAGAGAILVDCLTLWLANLMEAEDDLARREGELLSALAASALPTVLVSNEVGLGIVPENALARRFRDAQGRLNQAVARQADLVLFMAAGLPLVMKGALPGGKFETA